MLAIGLTSPTKKPIRECHPIFMVKPRVAVVAPTLAVMERFDKAMRTHAVMSAVCVDECETEEMVLTKINDLLSCFAVDVVVVAPACNHMSKSIKVPPSWDGIPVDQAVLETKLVSALTAVWTRSWLTKQYHFPLDGATS